MKRKPKKILYKDWVVAWLSYKKDYVKESTYANYETIIYNHLIPDLGSTYLKDMNHNLLQQYILDKLRSGRIKRGTALSDKSVKDIMMVLKSTLRYAMNQNVISVIQLDFTYPKCQKTPKMYILSKREQRKITDYIIENLSPRNLGILISLYSGMRIGEICALKWSDIDFKNNIIHVNKTLQRIYVRDGRDETSAKVVITSPKTATSTRDIPMSKEFASIIKPLKINSKFYILTASTECIEPRAYRKHFITFLKQLKMRTINFHSLRHTFATNCISLGIDYKTVSELLGDRKSVV